MPGANLSENALLEYMMIRTDVAVPLLVRDMGVSPSTAVGMISRLVDKGYARRADETPEDAFPVAHTPGSVAVLNAGRRGRPVVAYRLHMPGRVLALLVDGTLLAGILFERDLSILATVSQRLDAVTQMEDLFPLIEQLARTAAAGVVSSTSDETASLLLTRAQVAGVALVANAVDLGGKAMTSSVMPWFNDTLPARLAGLLQLPVVTASNIVAPTEFRVMNEPRPDPLVLVRVADGVSAHAVVAGGAFAGANRLSGELGHITVDPDGPLCGCGRRGCLETLCSGPAIVRRILDGLRDGAVSELRTDLLSAVSPRQAIEMIHEAYLRGDSFARDTIDRVLERLAWGVGIAVNLIDPRMVALGGYVFQNKPTWHEQMVHRSRRWIMHAGRRDLQIVAARATLEDELRLASLQFHFGAGVKRVTPAQPRVAG